jgi:intracellular sulfur oxidation DsrE/DsrF family protein
MSGDNSNLRFVACQRTIDQLESDGVGKVRLLPEVVRAGSGISQIVQRQQQGWSYIQI